MSCIDPKEKEAQNELKDKQVWYSFLIASHTSTPTVHVTVVMEILHSVAFSLLVRSIVQYRSRKR